jgi:hypothetical protein
VYERDGTKFVHKCGGVGVSICGKNCLNAKARGNRDAQITIANRAADIVDG